MSHSKLMEAASEILAGSKKAAAAMPLDKVNAPTDVVGGPSNMPHKKEDTVGEDPYADYKVNASVGVKSKATPPSTKPSAASSEMATKTLSKEESDVDQAVFAEDINALFADDSTISEDFKAKAATIFEARVLDRVTQIQEALEEEYATKMEEAVSEIHADLTEKVDDYLNYVVEQWLNDNEIAIESGLRAELSEDFIAGLRNLFAEHYIDVPAEKVDLVDELAEKVVELEGKLNEEIERGISTQKSLIESRKNEIVHAICEGLTVTQVEKIKALAESVEFSTEDEYKNKLETIRENYFPSNVKKADESQLHESFDVAEEKKSSDPFIGAVANAISKTRI